MDVGALIIIGGADTGSETISGVPIALLDVLGRSVLQRVTDRLHDCGISLVRVVGEAADDAELASFSQPALLPQQPWQAAQRTFSELVQAGAGTVVILRLGPYAEIDYEDLVRTHLAQRSRITAVVTPDGEMAGTFVVNARLNDAAYLLRHGLKTSRLPHSFYRFTGYWNPLLDAAHLRTLAIDAFCGNAELQPDGIEIRPGVWKAPSAILHKRARVLAPAYIGAHVKVRAAAVITRCSVLEHHAQVDCGTVVDNSTLLPDTSVGAGLDITHAVVGFQCLTHLGRNVQIEIHDPKLVGTVAIAPVRFLGHLASLASFLPLQIFRGLAGRKQANVPESVTDVVQSPTPALEIAGEAQFPANLVGARRYGDE